MIWFLRREKAPQSPKGEDRRGEILFIDASEMGFLKDRVHREFTDEDMDKISETYYNWRKNPDKYEDIKGFCKSASREEVEKHGFVLTPGRYVGITDAIDDGIPFEEKMEKLTAHLQSNLPKKK